MRTLIVIIIFIVVLGVVGNKDHEDALRDQQEYCTNVASGVWPDYNGNFSEVCK